MAPSRSPSGRIPWMISSLIGTIAVSNLKLFHPQKNIPLILMLISPFNIQQEDSVSFGTNNRHLEYLCLSFHIRSILQGLSPGTAPERTHRNFLGTPFLLIYLCVTSRKLIYLEPENVGLGDEDPFCDFWIQLPI